MNAGDLTPNERSILVDSTFSSWSKPNIWRQDTGAGLLGYEDDGKIKIVLLLAKFGERVLDKIFNIYKLRGDDRGM